MANSDQIPKPPEKPEPFECCGGGCVPCIFDYYEQKLMEWEQMTGLQLKDYQDTLPSTQTEKNHE